MLPYAIISDHALERGGNRCEEYIEAAKAKNISRLCLFDYDAMSAVISFIKSAQKSGVSGVVGVYLPVTSPALINHSSSLVYKKLIQKIPSLSSTLSSVSLEQATVLVDASIAFQKSKAKSKRTIFLGKLSDVGITLPDSMLDDVVGVSARLTPIINDPLHTFRLGFIANNAKGYKSLLKLASQLAMNQQQVKLGRVAATSEAESLTIEQVLEHCAEVTVIDPLFDDSLLGQLLTHDLPIDNNVHEIYARLGAVVGVSQIVKVTWLEKIGSFKKVPFPVAKFAESFHLEEFCVKHAALSKSTMLRLQYKVPVESNAFIWDSVDLDKYYESLAKKTELDLGFWEQVEDTEISLDKVMLPNYEFDEIEVAQYACEVLSQDYLNAVMCFDGIIKEKCPEGKAYEEYRREQYESYCMHKLAWVGVQEKCKAKLVDDESRAKFKDRFDMEFSVIESMGFSGYFLIMQDIIGYARKIGVPVGEARGSAAGSLIVYGLDITDIEPLQYDLQFERFLNPERVSMPDIDVDFGAGENASRDDVIDYIHKKYGNVKFPFSSVSQIANINRFGLKNSFDFACDAYGLPPYYKNYVKHLIEKAEVDMSIRAPESVSFKQLEEHDDFSSRLKQEPVLYKIMKRAKGLFKKKQTNGVHAGGVVISPTMIPDYSALGCSAKGALVSQFDKDDVESAGLVKLDILGLVNLSILAEANRQIFMRHGLKLDVRHLDREDEDVYDMINKGYTKGLFQIESKGMQSLVKNLQPISIEELGALSALFRPGALQSGMVEDYIDTKHGAKPLTFDHPAMQIATSGTYGCIVYQEQVMSIVQLLAGYTLGQADQLRRAMGKKKADEMVRHKAGFISGALKLWREDNIKKGESLFQAFPLDVNLDDMAARFEVLALQDCLFDGVFSSPLKTMEYMGKLMSLSEEAIETLVNRLNDVSYTVSLFKGHYQQAIYLSVVKAMKGHPDADVIEAKTRLYYALSQWVRFHWIFNKIEKFAGYGFNKSHAIGYAYITYDTAYFKYHYSLEFYAACLSFSDITELGEFAREAYQYKRIKLLKPDINKSGARFLAEGESHIRFGFEKLRNVKKTAANIVKSREKVGGFLNIWHTLYAIEKHGGGHLSADVLRSLALTGAFDMFIPKSIRQISDVNGRQFIEQISIACKGHPLCDLDEMEDLFSFVDFDVPSVLAVWCLAQYKKGLNRHIKENPEIITKDNNEELTAKVQVLTRLLDFGKVARANLDITERFNHLVSMMKEDDLLKSFVLDWMKITTSMGLVEAVSMEKHISGIYLTSNPLKAIDAYSKVEREPPGRFVDGCPVYIPDIDAEYEGEMISTVGVIKNIEERTITNPESTMFNQKILAYELEDGMHSINSAVIGTRAVKEMKKIIEEGTVIMAIGRIKNSERFGLSLSLEVAKRYYPVEDEGFKKVPYNR